MNNNLGYAVRDGYAGYSEGCAANPYHDVHIAGITVVGSKKYQISMKLPEDEFPSAIYVGGLRKTVGIFGTKAEVEILGSTMRFAQGTIGAFKINDIQSLIIEFKEATYQYHIDTIDYYYLPGGEKIEIRAKPVFVYRPVKQNKRKR